MTKPRYEFTVTFGREFTVLWLGIPGADLGFFKRGV